MTFRDNGFTLRQYIDGDGKNVILYGGSIYQKPII